MLAPLALLAVPGLLSITPRTAKVASAVAVGLFLCLALSVCTYWSALELGVPHGLHERLVWLQPAYLPRIDVAKLALALALSAGWGWLMLRFPDSPARTAMSWLAGMTLAWGLVALLLVRYIDTGKSYRSMVADLSARLPAGRECIASHGLGEPQRAMLHYFAGIATYRDELEPRFPRACDLLLVQGFSSAIFLPGGRWVKIWEGSRPGDAKELYRLYRLRESTHAAPSRVANATRGE
jgi:hypothetical protein